MTKWYAVKWYSIVAHSALAFVMIEILNYCA